VQQQDSAWRDLNRTPIYLNSVTVRVDLTPQLGNYHPIHPHSAGGDKLLHLPARPNATLRKKFL
jgi:hypothetical protein